ncbi:hypothetical protein [Streptomyces rimosus]|nr:hypothetical protein [Streptomyces rimosus]
MRRQSYDEILRVPHDVARIDIPTAYADRRIGFSVVRAIKSKISGLASLEDSLGSGRLHSTAKAELSLISTLLARATYDPPVGMALQTMAAEAAAECAWIAFDSGQHSVADAYYSFGLQAANTAGTACLKSYLLVNLAFQRIEIGQTSDAFILLRAAESAAHEGQAVRVTALVHAVRALVHADWGDATACARATDSARSAIQRSEAHNSTDPAYWVTESVVEFFAGTALLRLGRAKDAIGHFEMLHSGAFPVQRYPRDAAIYYSQAATAHLKAGNFDTAVDCADAALKLLDYVCSARATEAMTHVSRALSRYRTIIPVREFLDRFQERGSSP